MSNLKNIGNKLFKETTELKSQEVKLGAIDDLRDDYKRIASKAVPLKKIIQKASNDLSRVSDDLDSLQSKAKKLEEIAKELGAPNIVKGAQALSSSAKGLSSAWGKSALKISSAAKEI
jgi:DNA repair ATPase RecN